MTTEQDRVPEQEETSQSQSTGSATGTRRRRSPTAAKKSGSDAKPKRSRTAGAKAEKTTARPTKRRAPRKKVEPAPVEDQDQVPAVTSRPLPRLLQRFRDEISPALIREFGYSSPMQVSRLVKVVLNIGLGEALENPRAVESATRDLSLISGQRPVTTRARKSIAGFKLREGMAIGLSVTLRDRRMYEFVDRLISSVLPRIRDFRGLSREAFDGRGNYSLGIREHVIFPEIDYNTIDRIRGLQVVIVTTARTDREGLRMLELMGMPFARVQTEAQVA